MSSQTRRPTTRCYLDEDGSSSRKKARLDDPREEAARGRLALLFENFAMKPHLGFQEGEAISILLKFPSLLLERFKERAPISYFLEARAGLDVIQVVHGLMEDFQADNLCDDIHDACHFGDLEALEFLLLQKKPWEPINYVDTHYKKTPFQIVCERDQFRSWQRIDMIQAILEVRPSAILGDSNTPRPYIRFDDFLRAAFSKVYGRDIQQFILGFFVNYLLVRKDLTTLSVEMDAMNLNWAGLLAKLLRGLLVLKLKADHWDAGAFVDFLQAVATTKILKRLEISAPSQLFRDGILARDALQYALQRNETLESIVLKGTKQSNSAHDDTPPISLDISLCSASTLTLSYLGVNLSWSRPTYTIKELEIRELLSNLHHLPLTSLLIEHDDVATESADVTIPMQVSLGSHSTNIQWLSLELLDLDVEVLNQILRRNPQLESLYIYGVNENHDRETLECVANHLAHHSTTLDFVDTTYALANFEGEIPMMAQRISYYAALNQEGRSARASEAQLSAPSFVGLLCDVANATSSRAVDMPMERSGGDVKHNQQYGLLWIAPHVWSHI